jgi:hypothetical protein
MREDYCYNNILKILAIKKARGMLNDSNYISSYERQNLISFAFLHLNHITFIKVNGGLYGD